MKFSVSRPEFVNLIGKIQSIVPSKPAIPILANLLVETSENTIIISSTDLTVSMRAKIEATVLEEGAITLPARRLFQLIRELHVDTLEIESGAGEIAHIRANNSHFRLNGMHKSEYPTLPDLSDATEIQLPSLQLREMLTRTSFAAARDDSRHVLNGISLQIKNNQALFIGTDGKRLAKVSMELNLDDNVERELLIPLKAVEEMNKMLENDEQTKLLLLSDKIALQMAGVTLISKLLSGQFPDVDRVIPEKSERGFSLHREELLTLLRQVALFTSDRAHSVNFIFESGELELIASSSEIGDGKVSMPVDYSGERFEVAFNPYYFMDVLRHCKDDTVTFSISDPYNPGVVTDSSDALFVLMPMRLTANV